MNPFGRHGSGIAGGQMSVPGRPRDSPGFGDLGGAFPVGASGLRCCEGIGIYDGGGTSSAALGAGCGQGRPWRVDGSCRARVRRTRPSRHGKNFLPQSSCKFPSGYVRMCRPNPRKWRPSAMVGTSFIDRPRRFNFHTHKVSDGRRCASASRSPVRMVAWLEDLVFEDPHTAGCSKGVAFESGIAPINGKHHLRNPLL